MLPKYVEIQTYVSIPNVILPCLEVFYELVLRALLKQLRAVIYDSTAMRFKIPKTQPRFYDLYLETHNHGCF